MSGLKKCIRSMESTWQQEDEPPQRRTWSTAAPDAPPTNVSGSGIHVSTWEWTSDIYSQSERAFGVVEYTCLPGSGRSSSMAVRGIVENVLPACERAIGDGGRRVATVEWSTVRYGLSEKRRSAMPAQLPEWTILVEDERPRPKLLCLSVRQSTIVTSILDKVMSVRPLSGRASLDERPLPPDWAFASLDERPLLPNWAFASLDERPLLPDWAFASLDERPLNVLASTGRVLSIARPLRGRSSTTARPQFKVDVRKTLDL
ncbi:hypothetical protein LR48_Vigan102s000200 [Vigna angularis]|uniref:Uncharacterized protein n=1 Tax=Phaseolus angularis TaxID=3914 RepID=A0A0L9T5F9_PHAAN|nr:hypothetical protein LR48_Vigan102s000200 [Vigna angularis]